MVADHQGVRHQGGVNPVEPLGNDPLGAWTGAVRLIPMDGDGREWFPSRGYWSAVWRLGRQWPRHGHLRRATKRLMRCNKDGDILPMLDVPKSLWGERLCMPSSRSYSQHLLFERLNSTGRGS
jgi:hypothetical protein